MKCKRFSAKIINRLFLYVIISVFTVTSMTQTTFAADSSIDKNFFAGNDIQFYEPCGDGGETSTESGAPAGEYIKLKGIPEEGLQVGASVFGGDLKGDKWVENLADNGGSDLGQQDKSLTGETTFAELGVYGTGAIGNALGGLEFGDKIEIEYKGKKIIAVKYDVGTGGPDVGGKKRAVDLWWETANLLGFKEGLGVVTIHGVPKSTKETPLSSKPAAAADSTTGDSTSSTCCGTEATGDGKLMGKTREEQIWNYLTGRDGNLSANDALTPEQAAGLMGNLHAESGLNPGSVEKATGIGFGIAQWSFGRRTALEKAAKKKGVPVDDLKFQLDFLVQESKARAAKTVSGKEWAGMKKQKTVDDALVYWHDNFERSADSPARVKSVRGKFANKVYKKYKNSAGDSNTGGASGGAVSGEKTTVFLDPGHGGAIPSYIDKKSGFRTAETHNMPETADALDVANRVKSLLLDAGYSVEMARTSNSQKVTFRERADAAAKAKSAIGVSIHTTPGEINEAWPQRVGTKRSYNGKTETFTNKATASKSEDYAKAIAKARTAAEGHKVTTDPGNKQQASSFNRSGISSKGNIPLISLWSPEVPWVYNEIAQDKGTGISDARKKAYAKGIFDGIKEAVPAASGGCDSGADASGLSGYILKYAWPTPHPAPYTKAKPEYAAAVKKAQKEGRYVGGGINPGIDCGGFVTLLMTDSKFEPKYNSSGKGGNTISQQAWMEKNWKKLGSGSSLKVGGDCEKCLKLGDVAINTTHTFMFSGKDIPGFKTPTGVASASYSTSGASWRAPMAGREQPISGNYTWYRKK